MSSGSIPPKKELRPEEVLEVLQATISNNPRLADMPVEEIARQLNLEGRLEQEPPLALVEDALENAERPMNFTVNGRRILGTLDARSRTSPVPASSSSTPPAGATQAEVAAVEWPNS